MRFCDLVLVAGGKSTRFNSQIPKQFQNVYGRPLYLWSLETFLAWPHLGHAVIVVPEEWVDPVRNSFKELYSGLGDIKSIQVVAGGSSRQESGAKGVSQLLEISENDWVMVHDAARPCIHEELLNSMWAQCLKNDFNEEFGGVVPGVPAAETIKSVDHLGYVVETLKRSELRIIQTPQVGRTELLAKAYEIFKDAEMVDDASLIEKMGRKVLVVDGSYDNLKVTFSEDIERVTNWLRQRHPQV